MQSSTLAVFCGLLGPLVLLSLFLKKLLHVMFLLPLRFFFLLNVDFYHLLGLGDRRVRSLNNEGTGNRCHVTLKLLATQSSSYF